MSYGFQTPNGIAMRRIAEPSASNTRSTVPMWRRCSLRAADGCYRSMEAEVMSVSRCEDCGEYTVLLPLHGGKGGPLRCPLCIGKWNAEHGRKRRLGRIVI